MNDITNLISNVGFPITITLLTGLFGGKYFIELILKMIDESKKRDEIFFEFMKSMSVQMEKISSTMEHILIKIDKE